VKLWDVPSGRLLRSIEGGARGVTAVQFTADGHRVVSCDEGGSVEVRVGETGWEMRPPLNQKDWLLCLALSPDGRLAACGGKSSLAVWDLKTGERVHALGGHDMAVVGVAFTRDGRLLLSAGLDHLRLWDVGQGTPVHTFQGHGGGILSLAVSPNGRQFATGGFDRAIRLWPLPYAP
jgi:WD40 repeat protein